ncbi:hypothetical protein GQ44DRAFT_761665 [Phaeosphaeriaceae sp. PMI808]|nr:hypothetical protein GQ44DRAFT_761665 [Phaeosphaeriaceae sp. PMI808]
MNWTGGSLQRTKHANKGIAQKQKDFFARARTHLQNGTKPPVKPFRPSYLQNDNSFRLIEHPFGSGHVCRNKQSTKRYHEAMHQSRRASLVDGRLKSGVLLATTFGEDLLGASQRVDTGTTHSKHELQFPEHVDNMITTQRRKRQVDEVNPEAQLLEANRKRLLQQQDWIGVANSRPVSLQFLSRKEKSKVGKRRRVKGKPGVNARHTKNRGLVTNQLQHPCVNTCVAPTGAMQPHMQTHPDDIRIRIGTDALTTACSAQPNDYTRSQASSDAMLFDQQTGGASIPNVRRVTQSDTFGGYTPDPASHESYNDSSCDQACIAKLPKDDIGRPCRLKPNNSLRDCREVASPNIEDIASKYAEVFNSDDASASESNVSEMWTMQQMGGIGGPLRFVFGDSSSSGDTCTAWQDNVIGRAKHVLQTDHASLPQTGPLHPSSQRPALSSGNKEKGSNEIVDEQLWMSFLDIFDQGSSRTKDSQTSSMHQYPANQDLEAESTNWSQHATQGQQTHISSSLISASLPSARRQVQTRTHALDVKTNRDRRDPKDLQAPNEDERLWQEFVFGNNEVSFPDIIDGNREGSEEVPRAHSLESMPPAIAGSPVSSTPFRRGSASSPCNTPRFAPPSRIRAISFPGTMTAAHGEELKDGEEGEERAECSACGDPSVTHAFRVSLPNNASCETDHGFSRMFGHTETCRRRLEHISRKMDSLNNSRAPSHPERSTFYDTLDSDENGLDLVDADRL